MGAKTRNLSNTAGIDIEWQGVQTGNFTAVAGRGYFVNTTSTAITVTLPASPSFGDTIIISDYATTFATNNVTINPNGNKIEADTTNGILSTNDQTHTLVYTDSTQGWKIVNQDTTSTIQPQFTSATGGTITESGDYKIHTFTGDGCFVVSQIGNGPSFPSGGPTTVSYLVVAGGAGGGNGDNGGGGGAGGFREGRDISPSYTASPIVAPSGLTIAAQTYPITVGSGGAGSTTPPGGARGSNGSPSIFSTITSAGGGGGGQGDGPVAPGQNGGSGGGAGHNTSSGAGGTGNTPPTSPSQGTDGGDGAGGLSPPAFGGGGGGGASAAGADGTTSSAGNGGNGATTSISGSPTTYGGGGGGGAESNPQGGTGGPGGGGRGYGNGPTATPEINGTANTGGGGGSVGGPGDAGSGGSGIVIIRYKFQ